MENKKSIKEGAIANKELPEFTYEFGDRQTFEEKTTRLYKRQQTRCRACI
jgi:hypothetical protein